MISGNLFKIIQLNFLLLFMASSIHAKLSYSMHDSEGVPLDLKLVKIFNLKNGFFIEVGAYDGVIFSNTKLLEEKNGWKGILIEPSPSLFSKLCSNRPQSRCFQCALGSFEENGTYGWGDFEGGPMASLTQRTDNPQTVKVLIRSLQSILDECNITHIDFFSLDTEGYEWNILNGIDFSKTDITYMLIEIYAHHYDQITSFLFNHGYSLISCLSNYNKISNPGWDGTHNDYLFKKNEIK